MREPRICLHARQLTRGITPACAGTTELCGPCVVLLEDHPRVCGNHDRMEEHHQAEPGSPPRVREPRGEHSIDLMTNRITPACAGTTKEVRNGTGTEEDHPRVCGNHCDERDPYDRGQGSPPRVREPLKRCLIDRAGLGITPACAGTTDPVNSSDNLIQDHPRVCGNHSTSTKNFTSRPGSPPRVREPRRREPAATFGCRITPACAGTTAPCPHPKGYAKDHPRVCGNHRTSCRL